MSDTTTLPTPADRPDASGPEAQAPAVPAAGRPLPPRGPRTWAMILVGLVIVASGVVIGAGATVLVVRNRLIAPPLPDEQQARAIAADLRRRYALTEDQARRVQDIMARRMAAVEAIRQESHEKTTAEHDKLRVEMKEVLTPDQFQQWEDHFDSLRPPGFPPPPGQKGGPPGKGRPGKGPEFGPGEDRPMPRGQGPGPGRGPGQPMPPGGPGRGPDQDMPPDGPGKGGWRRGPGQAMPPDGSGMPGPGRGSGQAASMEAAAVKALGVVEDKPIDSGFVFIDGVYVEAPYTVSRRGRQLFINDILIYQWAEWPLMDRHVKEDPGPPLRRTPRQRP